MEEKAIELIEEVVNELKDLSREASLAYFDASISGDAKDYQRASELQLEVEKIFTDKEKFKTLSELKDSNEISDEIIKRQIEILYNSFAEKQIDEKLLTEIINRSTEIEKKFATYRAEVDGEKLTDNQIDEILKTSTDGERLRKTWEASKKIGEEIASDVLELVKLRNKSAKDLGFDNYHEMSLKLSEQDPEELDRLFDELDNLTAAAFKKRKEELDDFLAERYGIGKEELAPWHYQDKFFQQGPKIYDVDLDSIFAKQDLEELTKKYYASVGLDISDLMEKSDLYEKEGKYQHAYCTAIDREGDVRVLCNIKPNQQWMSTMLHEFGHAAYDKYVSPKLPWLLRSHAHIFATEAIAMLFGRMALNVNWLREMELIDESQYSELKTPLEKSLQTEQLVFSRWVQTVYRFEREMYRNPDQDLNSLWWNLVEKYQGLKKPEGRNKPDWAAKIHIALYPAYYHNYILGELLASQLYYYVKDKVLKTEKDSPGFVGEKNAGEYLKNLFLSYGAVFKWDKLIKNATGEELTPVYYAKQFVGE